MYPPAPPMPQKKDLTYLAGRILILLILIGALVFAVSFVFGCSIIPVPGYCDLWYDVMRGSTGGKPMALIVYGNEGLGNPQELEIALNDPQYAAARTTMLSLDRLSSGTLKKYDLVIVTKAKKMTAEQLQMFMEYVNLGGHLVWTGDAGTDFPLKENESKEAAMKRELLYEFEDPEQDSNADKAINPWARKF
ncbi:MAG: hypothetical protein JW703_03835, partial [Candidatus Diapherotrites archaeon]|nr:hypothetical protein [Candidatus Diapherotrites archaeon]